MQSKSKTVWQHIILIDIWIEQLLLFGVGLFFSQTNYKCKKTQSTEDAQRSQIFATKLWLFVICLNIRVKRNQNCCRWRWVLFWTERITNADNKTRTQKQMHDVICINWRFSHLMVSLMLIDSSTATYTYGISARSQVKPVWNGRFGSGSLLCVSFYFTYTSK